MEINSLHIGNFGTFSNYTLEFSKGMQIIHGCNEDGKTTLMTFLSMMFYSDQGRAQSIDRNPRKKYTPWNGKPMEGAIEFRWNDTNYHLSKQFGDTPGKDITTLTNSDAGTEIPLKRGEEIGAKFFGLDLSGFERSSFIGQIGSIDTGTGTDEISEKLLTNLVDTGSEDVSGQEIITRIKDSQRELLRSHNRTGLLADNRNSVLLLQEEEESIRHHLQSQQEFQQEMDNAETKHKRLEELDSKIIGYKALQQETKLVGLAKSQDKLKELGFLLSTSLYTPANLQELIDEGKILLTKNQELEQQLETLNTQGDQVLIPISPEELESFSSSYHQLETARFLNTNWKQETLPLLQNHRQEHETHQELLSSFHQLSESLNENQKNYQIIEEKNNTYLELSQEIKQKQQVLDNQKEHWGTQQKDREDRLSQSKEQLANTPESSTNNLFIPLLVLGALFSLGSIGSYLLLNNLLLLLVGGVGLILLAIALLTKTKGNPDYDRAKAQTDVLQEDFDHWKLSVSGEEEELTKIIHLLSGQAKELEQDIPHVDELQSAIAEEKSQLEILKEELTKAEIFLESKEREIQKQTHILVEKAKESDSLNLEEMFRFTSDSDQEKAITNLLENKVTTLKSQVSEAYNNKQVSSLEEFQKNTMETEHLKSHTERVEKVAQEQKSVQEEFLKTISLHTPVSSLTQGETILNQLETRHKSYNQLVEMIALTQENLGLSSENMEDMQDLIQEQHTLSQAYEGEDVKELQRELLELQQENLVDKMKDLQKQIQIPARGLEEIQSDLKETQEETELMEDYYNGLSLALDVMEDAREEMRQSFGPTLNKKTSSIFSQLTQGKYDTLQVDKAYNITVKNGVHLREWQYLSGGTIDQAYLSLRLAISSLVSPEEGQLPLLLDDVLIQYDDDRADTALQFLQKYGQENDLQILLFSCHKRMEDIAETHNIPTTNLRSK